MLKKSTSLRFVLAELTATVKRAWQCKNRVFCGSLDVSTRLGPVVRPMHRLRKEGLARHDAVHAIGSVVAEHLLNILKTDQNGDAAASQALYYAAVERLTAARWRKGEH